MSTSANGCAVATSPHRSVRYVAVGARDGRAATRRPFATRPRARDRGRAVARARVLQPAVDDGDDGAGAGPLPSRRRTARRRTAGRTRAARPTRGSRARRAREQTRRAGPRRADPRAPRAGRSRPGPTSTTGSHTAASTRAARAASVSPSTTSVALSVPIRRLAPPVSSTPAIWRSAVTGVGRRRAPAGPQRVADDDPAVRALLEHHVVAHARALRRPRG